jgi:hypothetical protein
MNSSTQEALQVEMQKLTPEKIYQAGQTKISIGAEEYRLSFIIILLLQSEPMEKWCV